MKKFTILFLLAASVLLIPGADAYAQTYSAWSQNLSNPAVAYDTSYNYNDTMQLNVPANAQYAYGNVKFTVYYEGDLGDVSEYFSILLEDGNYFGQAGPHPSGSDCMPEDSVMITVSAISISPLMADGMIGFKLVPSSNVDYFCNAVRAKIRIEYDYCTSGVPAVIPTVTVSMMNSTICHDGSPVLVMTSPSGGTLSGPGVSGSTVSAASLLPGNYTITYVYTDTTGCQFSNEARFTVLNYPVIANDTICAGENTVLQSSSVSTYWFSDPGLSNLLGSGQNLNTGTISQNTDFYAAIGCPRYSFKMDSITANNYSVVDHNALTGDDRGGIAVTMDHIYYTGDDYTVRYDLNLNNGVSLNRNDAFFSDLENGKLWSLYNSAAGSFTQGTIDAICALDSNLVYTSEVVQLSQVISMNSGGIYAGKGFVILFNANDNHFYLIDNCSGNVTDLGQAGFSYSPYSSENWANWGIAEFDGTNYSVLYTYASSIYRMSVPAGTAVTMQPFNALSDMACFTYASWNNRWYYHYEGSGQFGGSSETLGYADAADTTANHSYSLTGCVEQITVVADACTGTAENDEISSAISAYPNPNNGLFTITAKNLAHEESVIEVTDIHGRVVFSSNVNHTTGGFTQTISLENAADGIYLLRVINGTTVHNSKISVVH